MISGTGRIRQNSSIHECCPRHRRGCGLASGRERRREKRGTKGVTGDFPASLSAQSASRGLYDTGISGNLSHGAPLPVSGNATFERMQRPLAPDSTRAGRSKNSTKNHDLRSPPQNPHAAHALDARHRPPFVPPDPPTAAGAPESARTQPSALLAVRTRRRTPRLPSSLPLPTPSCLTVL